MLTHLRQRIATTLAPARCVTLATRGPAGLQAHVFPCVASGIQLYLLLPPTSDHLLNLEHDPLVVVTTAGWQVRGRARILTPAEQFAAGALLDAPDAPWCVVVEVQRAIVCSEHAGLAVYRLGRGEPLLLMPAPHGFVAGPTSEGRLAALLTELGHTVITFDPPGAFRSTRPARVDLAEMLGCASEALAVCGVDGPVDLVGHSMSGLCALALAVEQPQAVRRLLLMGSVAGGPSVLRGRGLPLCWSFADPRFWRAVWLGMWLGSGRGTLSQHKRMLELIWRASYHDPELVPAVRIEPADRRRPAPLRDRWPRSIDYRGRLADVRAPTLVCVGRYDPQAPILCSEELARGIPGARLAIFEHSGHHPIEASHGARCPKRA